MDNLINSVNHADLFDLCAAMPSQSVDMILCDLPYGTTDCAWDSIIPFEPMWKAFKRITKPKAAIVLTAAQPFTSALVMSNPKMFRYALVYHKTRATTFALAQFMPLRAHEDVLIFSYESPVYYPQMIKGERYKINKHAGGRINGVNKITSHDAADIGGDNRYPQSVITFSNSSSECNLHPTQKPVDLFRYLIRTYTTPNQLIFDPCVGSGTTAIAAREEGRSFIVGDSSLEYVEIARARLAAPYTPSFMPTLEATQ